MAKSIYKSQVGRATRRLFFMNGKLYKKLHVYRAGNLLYAWDFEGHQRVTFLNTDVKKLAGKAYSTAEVAEMLGIHRQTVHQAIVSGEVATPPQTYSLSTNNDNWTTAPRVWSKEAILDLHENLISRQWRGRSSEYFMRNRPLPNRLELLSMLEQGTVLYVKDKNGEFVPAWKAPEW